MGVWAIEELWADETVYQAAKPDDALRSNIRKDGVLVPLIVTEDGFILDGHGRLAVARETGLREVPVVMLPVRADESWERTLQAVMRLPKLPIPAVRAALGSSLLRRERERARERQREGGRRSRRGVSTGAGISVETSPHLKAPTPDRASERAARAVGITRKALDCFLRLQREFPLLATLAVEGKITLETAWPLRRCYDRIAELVRTGVPLEAVALFQKAIDVLEKDSSFCGHERPDEPRLLFCSKMQNRQIYVFIAPCAMDDLSPKERAVVRQLGRGLGNGGIAQIMGTTESAVRNALSRIYRK